MCVTPLNSVPYTGLPVDHSQQNEANPVLKNHPSMVFLPQPTTVKELNYMLSDTKNGIAVSGGAASGQTGPLIGSSDISESEDGFLFRVALPDIKKNEEFKCDVQEDGTITIHRATSTGGKKVHSHNMVFDMHTENLCPPGDLSVSFHLEHVLDNGVLEGLSRRNRSNMDWADQVPIAATPLNSVPHMGPAFGLSRHNALLNHPTMVHLPESTTVEELNKILSIAKKGIAVSGCAAGGQIRPLIGSFDVSDIDGGFLFCVALPGVEKNEKFKCDVQEDRTITIHGATSTGGKKVHSHNVVFNMHTENLCLPEDLSVSYSWPAHVDPTTLERVLDNGVLEGLSRRNRSNMDLTDQVSIAVAPLNSVPYTGPPFNTFEQNQPLNRTTMVMLHESTTVEELKQILSIKGLAVEGGASSDLLGPLIGAFGVSDNDDEFLFRVALPGAVKNEKSNAMFEKMEQSQSMEPRTSTGGKKVHSHNMVFDMHTQNLCPPGDFSASFKLPAHVDPTTSEHVLDNGVFEGLIKKKQV